jgi:hypothetical protein
MTERKPPGASFESWVEQRIREAADRGEFDNLPGAGKPLPGLADPDDEMWWLKGHLRREGLPTEAVLPTPLQLRRQVERLPDTVRGLTSEPAVRDVVDKLNRRIADWLRTPSGPAVTISRVDPDDVVAQWRAARRATARRADSGAGHQPTMDESPAQPTGWWRRIARRRRESG